MRTSIRWFCAIALAALCLAASAAAADRAGGKIAAPTPDDYYRGSGKDMPRAIGELPEPIRTPRPDNGEAYSRMAVPDQDKHGAKRRKTRVLPPFRQRAEVEDTFPEDDGPVYSEAHAPPEADDPDLLAGGKEVVKELSATAPASGSADPATTETASPQAVVARPMGHTAPPGSSFDPYEAPPERLPTPEGVEDYRARLEERLLERYNNLPDYAGKVGLVRVVLSRPLETSIDGKFIRAEFDQLVYDLWGKRLTRLEEEYFTVTFGEDGAQRVRSEPSIRVGLDLKGAYSEMAPPIAWPLEKIDPDEAFDHPPAVKMPSWWRPEFPELQ
ncbi:MAG: hypothetical protein LBT97_07925 [Planctomycetota bacterium]|jgi:hypothetical protein|nr:hypothetical protein [Planctomycetota bacterium]